MATGGRVAGSTARLLFTAFLTYLFIWLPIGEKNSAMLWFAQDLSTAHLFLRIVWIASPLPAAGLAMVCALIYAAWTVRTRRGRLTTTFILPPIATIVLFVLMYQYPQASFRHAGEPRPDFVVRVWDRRRPGISFSARGDGHARRTTRDRDVRVDVSDRQFRLRHPTISVSIRSAAIRRDRTPANVGEIWR